MGARTAIALKVATGSGSGGPEPAVASCKGIASFALGAGAAALRGRALDEMRSTYGDATGWPVTRLDDPHDLSVQSRAH